MPRIRLSAEAPEGGPGHVVSVSRSRAADLVNGGQAERVLDREPATKPVITTPRPSARPRARKT